MRRASRTALVVAAVALPLAVLLGSYAVTGGGRAPRVPEQVRIGDHSGPTTPVPRSTDPRPQPSPSEPPAPPEDDDRGHVPPPPPVNDDADDRDDRRDDD